MQSEEALAPESIEGEYGGGGALQSEPTSELAGRGTLTVRDDGLHVVATWRRMTRRVLSIVMALFGAAMLGGALGTFTQRSAVGVAGFVALSALGVWASVRGSRPLPYERLVPWREVTRPGMSEGGVIFEVSAPRRGTVRFRAAGWDASRTRALAQEIVRRARGV